MNTEQQEEIFMMNLDGDRLRRWVGRSAHTCGWRGRQWVEATSTAQ